MPVDADFQKLLDMINAMPQPDYAKKPGVEIARQLRTGPIMIPPVPQPVRVESREVPGPGGNIPIRIYRPDGANWTRTVIDEEVTDGHTLLTADLDGDGTDEVIVGERGGKRSVYIYRAALPRGDTWTREVLDDGGMAGAGCAAADLDGDRRPDIVCIGTATANLKWYRNDVR